MSTWPGDAVTTRSAGIGTLNCKIPEAHPVCTVCGCDCTGTRIEFFGFIALAGHPECPIEYVLITTCLDHWHEPLCARLAAAA